MAPPHTKINKKYKNCDTSSTSPHFKSRLVSEETKTSSMTNKFELKKYEETIINNFVNSQLEKFVFKITSP